MVVKVHDEVAIFLGPSLDQNVARRVLNAGYRSPAVRGDLLKAIKDGAETIVLIDAHIVNQYPPSPKEVKSVLDAGVNFIGAASLGALRAVELRTFGAIGVGWVYENYLVGAIEADDELIVSMDPTSYSALTIPLVNVRYALGTLSMKREITRTQAQEVLAALKELYFEERTIGKIREIAMLVGLRPELLSALTAPENDIKARDALSALKIAANSVGHCTAD